MIFYSVFYNESENIKIYFEYWDTLCSTLNDNDEIIYLVYFDANNFYGWGMVQALPFGGFKWVPNSINFNIPDDSLFGYILEANLEYPEELHDTHSDLPFCPEHSKSPGSKQEKLVTTPLPKRKHVLHYRALKQALANGLKLVKIHRIISTYY